MNHPQLILTLSCRDQPGIVGAVGTFLADWHCNIIDSAQFGDLDTGRFMMRVLFEQLDDAGQRTKLASAFGPIMRKPVAITESGEGVGSRSPASCSITNSSYGLSALNARAT